MPKDEDGSSDFEPARDAPENQDAYLERQVQEVKAEEFYTIVKIVVKEELKMTIVEEDTKNTKMAMECIAEPTKKVKAI